jgi:hypothetical protein
MVQSCQALLTQHLTDTVDCYTTNQTLQQALIKPPPHSNTHNCEQTNTLAALGCSTSNNLPATPPAKGNTQTQDTAQPTSVQTQSTDKLLLLPPLLPSLPAKI